VLSAQLNTTYYLQDSDLTSIVMKLLSCMICKYSHLSISYFLRETQMCQVFGKCENFAGTLRIYIQ
jgi:hypothetical protein